MSIANTLDSAAAAPAAIATFLRGVERRAAILAEQQCGDPEQGDRALGAAMDAFVTNAPETLSDEWPQLFWTQLLQSPALHVEPVAPYWHGDFAPLSRLDFGTRAALLLRVVAGLDDTLASAVFGVAPAEFRQALQRGLPQRADGSLDGEAWLALNDEARFALKNISPERVAGLARLRDAAIAVKTPEAPTVGRGPLQISLAKPRWLDRLLGGAGAR